MITEINIKTILLLFVAETFSNETYIKTELSSMITWVIYSYRWDLENFFKRFHLKSVAICGMKDDIVTGMKNEHKMTNKDILVEHRVKCNELELKN